MPTNKRNTGTYRATRAQSRLVNHAATALAECWKETLMDVPTKFGPTATEISQQMCIFDISFNWCDLEDNGTKEQQRAWLTEMISRVVPVGNTKFVAGIVDMILHRQKGGAALTNALDTITEYRDVAVEWVAQ